MPEKIAIGKTMAADVTFGNFPTLGVQFILKNVIVIADIPKFHRHSPCTRRLLVRLFVPFVVECQTPRGSVKKSEFYRLWRNIRILRIPGSS